MENKIKNKLFLGEVDQFLLIVNIIVALLYISWWADLRHVSNPYLYGLLSLGEAYHVFMAIGFWLTIWPGKKLPDISEVTDFFPTVDIFITVAGEPVELVQRTIQAAKEILYPNKTIYVLNDGFVAKKSNWQEIDKLAEDMGVHCFTRTVAGGSKAGNINNALKQTKGEFVAIFDADMLAYSDFLVKTVPYFKDSTIGFVQTPQYYKNYKKNEITAGSWEQQEIFFGPIMVGKNARGAAFICGTNVVIRKLAFYEVGGMVEDNIAEDFLTSMLIHKKKWKSYYTSEVLSEGLAPEDLLSYFKQQLRWARGSLESLFTSNPLFIKGLTMSQRFQYLLSALYYLNGLIILIDCLMPLFFLFFGTKPVASTTTSFALLFIPFMFFNLYTLFMVSGNNVTFRAISFVQGSWFLQIRALVSIILRQKMGFVVTPKQQQKGNYLFLVYPHIIYIVLVVFASWYRVGKEGIDPSVITNIAWGIFNMIMFMPFIWAAFPWKKNFATS